MGERWSWLQQPSREEISRAVYVSRLALRGLLRSRLPQMAAALSYRTLFSLLPVSIVALVLVRSFVSDAELAALVKQAIEYSGIAEVIRTDVAEERSAWGDSGGLPLVGPFETPFTGPLAGPPASTPESPDSQAALGNGADAPEESRATDAPSTPNLDAKIEESIGKLGQVRFAAIGVIGGIVLIYAALSMLVEIERAFNQICRAETGRSWVRRITQYWTLLTLGSIFLAGTFLLTIQVRGWVDSLADGGDAWGRLLVGVAAFGVTTAISTLLLLLAYSILPNRRLRLRPTAAGALVAAVCWEAGKWGFTQYLEFASTGAYATLYGSLALAPLFMLWIYVTWLIVLFGLQVAYGVQMLEDGVDEAAETDTPQLVLGGPGVLIDAAAVVARRFQDGKAASTAEVAGELGIRARQADRLLDVLAKAGFVREVDEDIQGVTLARPADRIQLKDLLDLARTLARIGERQDSASGEILTAAEQALGGATLAERISGPDSAESAKDEACPTDDPHARLRIEPDPSGSADGARGSP
ncbi:MAG: YhjD/YihY/BrkB family envelope integrity protein [Planctomycetota bacterium]